MSSERCKSIKSSLILSSQVSFGLPLLLLPSTLMVSTVLTVAIVGLLLIWPNHLNLPSFILSDILATPKCVHTSTVTSSSLLPLAHAPVSS
ncbi:hypothetical protein Hanom_Chr00s001907g01688771 [Helianthus anomalus]